MCAGKQAIQAGGLTNSLPDLATPSTVFAPVNSAFYHILTGTGALITHSLNMINPWTSRSL